jgi:sporulation integral membrane protein YtvI
MDNERYAKDKAAVIAMIKYILMAAIAVVLLLFATKLVSVLVPFLIGFLLAKTSMALAEPVAKSYKGNKPRSLIKKRTAVVVYVILLVFIAIFCVWGIITLLSQMSRALNTVSHLADTIDPSELGSDLIAKFSADNGGFLTEEMIVSIKANIASIWSDSMSALPALISSFLSSVLSMVSSIPYWIFVIICVILSGYYFINDGYHVLRFYMKNVPNRAFKLKSLSLINTLSVTLFRALGGYLLLLIMTTVEAWFAFHLAGVDYAVILALITGIIDFMPVLGISATMIPVMAYCALHGNYRSVIILAIAMAVMTVVRRLAEPPILGKSLHLHPLLMLLGMALGVYVWGAIGFLLGPTVMIIIIDVAKVFAIDKKIMNFLSRVIGDFMKPTEGAS